MTSPRLPLRPWLVVFGFVHCGFHRDPAKGDMSAFHLMTGGCSFQGLSILVPSPAPRAAKRSRWDPLLRMYT